jgi:hypothetical protein
MHQVQLCCPEMEFLNDIFRGVCGHNLESSQNSICKVFFPRFPWCKMLFMNRLFSCSADFFVWIFLSGFSAEEVKFANLCSRIPSQEKNTLVHHSRQHLPLVHIRPYYSYWIVPRSAYYISDRRIASISYIYKRQPQRRKARELTMIGVSLAQQGT